ncbi:nucleotidyltransferase family protein [Alicyclobacillus sp. SO9]|uniref:nucleotidyltransferase family protein n=1 Tax=Alicyclobacillus sp. SO9 TaxID=2665646 RepID=UPI0018E89968|nr:nucleotidyltransferase family protein [Alicyclobacillus sp. SO9]
MVRSLDSELISILSQHQWFMKVLRAVRSCNPPDWLVGGGVIRTIVWDYLHDYMRATQIRDVDVAFFDDANLTRQRDVDIQARLQRLAPDVPWEAINQAAVHLWYETVFGYPVEPLTSSADAIATWPEPATCVAVRLLENNEFLIVAPYGLDDLFKMTLRHNPRRITKNIFLDRVRTKEPLKKWPKVKIIYSE